jgi:ATP-dependent DNA helicase RecG
MIIYPLVEESEKSDLSAAVEAHQQLDEIIFPDISVGLIHGRMTSDEKDEIMARFSKNEISILVSTTVIEVGVDIPNATVMMIEHAERFGLTQLHQLRGRVGRGVEKSYCIMVKRDVTDPSRKRLSIMEKTNDGFIIADEDLKLRGPGEFFGLKQSGFFQFKIANMVTDGVIIRDARKVAFELIEQDPNLKKESNQVIREIFLRDYADRLENISLS